MAMTRVLPALFAAAVFALPVTASAQTVIIVGGGGAPGWNAGWGPPRWSAGWGPGWGPPRPRLYAAWGPRWGWGPRWNVGWGGGGCWRWGC